MTGTFTYVLKDNEILATMLDAEEHREAVALVTVTAATGGRAAALGRHMLVRMDPARASIVQFDAGELQLKIEDDIRAVLRSRRHTSLHYTDVAGELELFVEVHAQPPHLIIVGAGHIAVPLAAIAKICDFHVTVIDDRAQYANRQRFPAADRIIAGPFRDELRRLREEQHGFDEHTYLVLVTRGHQYDVECLLEVLDDPLAYVGMIGSQRRIQAVFALLEQQKGIAAEKFDHIHAPIGLAINAETPAEIAVCIMGEIINVQRGGPGLSLSDHLRQERAARRARAQSRLKD
ncbi:MAG: XdhC family protein [Caldilineaceae bacterium]|nr:XdhC family protein [Caldilineaceae bacterium]